MSLVEARISTEVEEAADSSRAGREFDCAVVRSSKVVRKGRTHDASPLL